MTDLLQGAGLRDLRIECGLALTREKLKIWQAWARTRRVPFDVRCSSAECLFSAKRRLKLMDVLAKRQARDFPIAQALRIERIVCGLPERQRLVVKVHWLSISAALEEKLRAARLAKTHYYELLRTAELMIRNLLYAHADFRAELELSIAEEIEALEVRLTFARRA